MTGPLAVSSSYNLSCTGTGGTASKTVTISVGQPSSGGGLAMPSLDDERSTYNGWGWSWTTDKEPGAVNEPVANFTVSSPDLHYDTEGDDLWTYLMMYRRTNNPVYLNRAQAWANYFKNNYLTSAEFLFDSDGFLLDHIYGWGLVTLYEHNGDTAALATAEGIAAKSEAYWSPSKFVPGYAMGTYGFRQGARNLLLATRVAEATNNPRWIALRDKLINLWLGSSDWNAARGMYCNRDFTDAEAGAGTYSQGGCVVVSFQLGILSEAFAHAYRTTGRTELRDRMIAMARFVDQYGLDPTYQYTGKRFGVVNNLPWHDYSRAGGTVTFWDAVYTTSLVNTLVRGYKYTGDTSYYARAKHFFNRGTKGVYGNPGTRTAADNVVHHFMDTRFDSSSENFFLSYNKGELQYTYLLFEYPHP